jgi:hypothetical protein
MFPKGELKGGAGFAVCELLLDWKDAFGKNDTSSNGKSTDDDQLRNPMSQSDS